MVSRFCYNHGEIKITVSNVALLHSCAVFLGMTENLSTGNLLKQTETFLDGVIDWSWHDIIASLKSCESFFTYSDTSGLVEKLIFSLLEKLAQNSDIATLIASSSSSSSSPETASRFRFSSSAKTTPESTKPGSSSKQWWFDDLIVLPPMIIEKVIANMGAYGTDNNSLILTRFLLHYLKNAELQCKGGAKGTVLYSRADYAGLASTAVHGKLKKVGRLIDKYLCEISPDQNLKTSKLLGVAESLPDSARDCFDGVYKAIDIYLQIEVECHLNLAIGMSHPTLSFEERSRLCGCLNYAKMSLEACKDLAKNPRIPPNIAVQALKLQHSKIPERDFSVSVKRHREPKHEQFLRAHGLVQ
ncbi:hypothetical protein OIU77_013783 [Salix suchowensis]|uniref:NPH3 domain-containing protein n=1 Tax=Salix suchowensis TaxID=1278906 RepID=A0ABQ8ZVA0_9ROSI|nr:hypothetical protein OIU77_013783 [Salix suchowensis]